MSLEIVIRKMRRVPADRDRETVARFSAVLVLDGTEILTLPDMRLAVKSDTSLKVVPPVHRVLPRGKVKAGDKEVPDVSKCFYASKPLLEKILPIADAAFQALVKSKG